MIGWLLILLALATTPPQSQRKPVCKGNLEIVGPCFKVHGRVVVGNGTPSMRMWVIGTSANWGSWDLRRAFEKNDFPSVYGYFEVCPFTKRKAGEMQNVCVESAEHLVVVKNSD